MRADGMSQTGRSDRSDGGLFDDGIKEWLKTSPRLLGRMNISSKYLYIGMVSSHGLAVSSTRFKLCLRFSKLDAAFHFHGQCSAIVSGCACYMTFPPAGCRLFGPLCYLLFTVADRSLWLSCHFLQPKGLHKRLLFQKRDLSAMYFTPDVTGFMLTVQVCAKIAGLLICSD